VRGLKKIESFGIGTQKTFMRLACANGAHHSLAAYGARKNHTDGDDVDYVMIYDPNDGYNNDLVSVDSRDTIHLHAGNAKIDSIIMFNY
jgi:hypothetical protein